ncbi:unnamed protein product, partial [Boreogadus saida]
MYSTGHQHSQAKQDVLLTMLQLQQQQTISAEYVSTQRRTQENQKCAPRRETDIKR